MLSVAGSCCKVRWVCLCLILTICRGSESNQTTTAIPTTSSVASAAPATTPPPALASNASATATAVATNVTLNATVLQSPPPQKPPPALGLACNTTTECKANFSTCTEHVCTCQAGYISSKESLRCLHVVSKLGEGCSEDEQCTAGLSKHTGPSTCLNFICSCAIGMSLVDGKCQGPTVLNEKCSNDEDCTIKRSTCTDGMCLCLPGFVPSSDNNVCLPVNLRLQKTSGGGAGSGSGGCSEDIQCQNGMGDLAVCIIDSESSSCQCQPGTHLVNSKCIKYKELGESCSYNEECLSADMKSETVNSRICNSNKCACDTGDGWIQLNNFCTGGASGNGFAGGLVALLVTTWILMRL